MTTFKPRTLKIERIGDFNKGKSFPRIRLKGRWLAQAGLEYNNHVEITQPMPGVLVLKLVEKEENISNK